MYSHYGGTFFVPEKSMDILNFGIICEEDYIYLIDLICKRIGKYMLVDKAGVKNYKRILSIMVFSIVVITEILIFSFREVLIISAKETELKLYAKAAVLMDADSGRVLYGKNADVKLAMASTTKIMTLIVTLENANLEDTVTVSEYASKMPDVQLNIKEGEQYKLKDLTYSLMLESHNDSAVAIAEHVGGSVEGFAKLMNKKAKEIGCKNTYFITPNGLDATDEKGEHSTTAADLALIMSYCIKKSPAKEMFLEITRVPLYTFSDLTGTRSFSCNNHNAFLNMMSGALSGKTGFTNKAGYCYVGALERDGKTLVVALLACGWPNHKTYKWSDTKALMEYGLENYKFRYFAEANVPKEAFEKIKVNGAKGKDIGEAVYSQVKLSDESKFGNEKTDGLLMNNDEKITVVLKRKNEVNAPVKEGEVIGYISYYIENKEWRRTELVIGENKEKIDFKWCIKQILCHWLI